MLTILQKHPAALGFVSALLVSISGGLSVVSEPIGNVAVIQGIDASVNARDTNVVGYTVNEHYAVFRHQDQDHPAAEMTVKTTYQKDIGKSFTILSESGSELLRKQVLDTILEREKLLTQPANRANAVITSSNYVMEVKGAEVLNGRNCLLVSITPKRNSPYLFTGTIWVDAQDYSIAQFQGIASKSPSVLTGAAQVSRQYAIIDGFPMATHAKAVSTSWLLGQTTIKIDYTGYDIKLRAAP